MLTITLGTPDGKGAHGRRAHGGARAAAHAQHPVDPPLGMQPAHDRRAAGRHHANGRAPVALRPQLVQAGSTGFRDVCRGDIGLEAGLADHPAIDHQRPVTATLDLPAHEGELVALRIQRADHGNRLRHPATPPRAANAPPPDTPLP